MKAGAAWAPFLTEAEVRMLLTLVEAEVQSLGAPYRIRDGIVEVDLDDGTQSLGLSNLAQVCAGIAAADWPAAVARHFELVMGSSREENELRGFVHDFERVAPMLRVRLYESCSPGQLSKTLAPGLEAGVVFDLTSAMRSVTREEASAWERSDDEVFSRALDNLAREELGAARTIIGPEEIPIVVVEGASYYTASQALRLEPDVVPEGHPYGALFIVPSRHVYFYHVIEDSRVIVAVNALVSLAIEAYKRGPGSISDGVFWVRNGAIVPIGWEVQEGTLFVSPPGEFVRAVLEPLARPPS